MKIKNVSKKIIGNQDFRLLPGETMEVAGDELWVKDYLAEKKLKAVAEEGTETDNEPDHADDKNPAEDSAEASPEGQDDEAKTTARGRKK